MQDFRVDIAAEAVGPAGVGDGACDDGGEDSEVGVGLEDSPDCGVAVMPVAVVDVREGCFEVLFVVEEEAGGVGAGEGGVVVVGELELGGCAEGEEGGGCDEVGCGVAGGEVAVVDGDDAVWVDADFEDLGGLAGAGGSRREQGGGQEDIQIHQTLR